METPPSPIIFHFVNPNELERGKIKILKIKRYNATDTFEMLIQTLLKKYKNLYPKENVLYVGDFTLLYNGISLKPNISVNKVNIPSGEPIILLLNKYSKGPIHIDTALNVMNILFPTQIANMISLSDRVISNSDSVQINTNINTNSTNITPYLPPLSTWEQNPPLNPLNPPQLSESIYSNPVNQFNTTPVANDTTLNENYLIDMGFSESIARTAIQNTHSLEEAINLLVGDV
jgi:hypothetical protein